MRIDVERFLTITAMLAAGTAVALGCSSEDVENNPKNDGGISGASGRGGSSGSSGTGGSSGSAGTAGSAGAGGTAGTGGTGGTSDASTDTGGTGGTAGADGSACLGDTSATDAGAEPCDDLPYASAMCGDGGNESPLGMVLCVDMAVRGRDGVFEALKTCLGNASNAAAACSTAHDNAVQACIDDTFTRACDVSSTTTGDGSVFTCVDISAACEVDGAAPLSEQECSDSLNAFTSQARGAIYDCWNRNPDGDCRDTFETCVFDPDYNQP